MLKNLLMLILSFSAHCLSGQNPTLEDTISIYFEEIKLATAENHPLWERNLYAPILLINANTRMVYGNEPDTEGHLKKHGKIFEGRLPKTINIANTSITWSGKRWATVTLPLSDDKKERLNLVAHELFHIAQPDLGFILREGDNSHLDKRDGRIYLRLELNALQMAVLAPSEKIRMDHVANALVFRKIRNQIYPGSDSTENLLELNEGIAEYTGLIISGRNKTQMINHLRNSVESFSQTKTFVRSFAYHTIPIYGYILYGSQKNWNKKIASTTNLINYFQKEFHIDMPENVTQAGSNILKLYGGETIIEEEKQREVVNNKLVESQIEKFVTKPHLEIPFENMNISFDPGTLISLNEFGTVYPTLRVTDNWGILSVQDGALISPNWNKVIVSPPEEVTTTIIKGRGWQLEINSSTHMIRKDGSNGNYYLVKTSKGQSISR